MITKQLLQPGVSYRTFTAQIEEDDHTTCCPDCNHTANELFVAGINQDDANFEFECGRGRCADCYVRETIDSNMVIVPVRAESKTLMEVFTGVNPKESLRDAVQKLLADWVKAELGLISEFSGDMWTDTEKLETRANEFITKWNALHKPDKYIVVPESLVERMAEVRSMQAAIQ